MKALIRRLFYDPAWAIGYRKLAKDDMLSSADNPHYQTIKAKQTKWFADPFLFEVDHELYLFAEIKKMWTGKAVLGVAKFNGTCFSSFETCLEEAFHLSYPNVFWHKNEIYMLPETSHIHQLRLYKATEFPIKWELCSVLMDHVDYADCSILEQNGKRYLFCYNTGIKPAQTLMYELDIDSKTLCPIELQDYINERPAGNVLFADNQYYRPLQDCTNSYGDHLIIMKTTAVDPYSEIKAEIISAADVSAINDKTRYSRIHTLNRAGGYEVVDLGFDKFYLSKMIRKIYLKLFVNKRKKPNERR